MLNMLPFAARIYYFHSIPPVILGVIYLAFTREFLINHRLHDYNTPEALQYTRPEPCTGASLVLRVRHSLPAQ